MNEHRLSVPLPPRWTSEKIKHVALVQASNVDKHAQEDETPIFLCNYTDVYKNDRITADLPFMQATAKRGEIERFALRAGDVLITKDSETWDDIAVPAFVPQNLPGVVCGYHLSQIRPLPDRLDGAFLFYALKSSVVSSQLHVLANGVTRFGLPAYSIENASIPLPPLPVQRAIAAFLDERTARIDALIAKKRRLLELLDEQRRALVTRAVTKGLDPTVPMKDTGTPWLGEVPAHWEVKRLKFVVPGLTVGVVVQPSQYYLQDGIPFIRAVNIVDGAISSEDLVFLSSEANMRNAKSRIFKGDILIIRSGRPGAAAIVTDSFDGANCVDLLIVRRSIKIASDFFMHVLAADCTSSQIQMYSVGAIQSHYNTSTLSELTVVLPPHFEQVDITKKLEVNDKIARGATSALHRLTEYRAALITAVVTGKIDVADRIAREAA